ncbi:hypothetical protein LCGC14_2819740, partial [marine sediment metagenome]
YSIFKVSGLSYIEGEVPYADTLTNYDMADDGIINIFHGKIGYGDGELDSTSGYIEDRYICNDCGRNAGEDYQNIFDEIICETCAGENYRWCDVCEEYVSKDDIQHVESVNRSVCDCCLCDNYYQCNDCSEWFEECTEVGGEQICYGCLDEYDYCEVCGEYASEDLVHIEDVNIDICSDCAKDYQTCDCGLVYDKKSNCECLFCKQE